MSHQIIEALLQRVVARGFVDHQTAARLRARFGVIDPTLDSQPDEGGGEHTADLDGVLQSLADLGLARTKAMELVADLLGLPEPYGVSAQGTQRSNLPTRTGGRAEIAPTVRPWQPPHYRLGERIGSGAVGDVFRARDLRLGRDVAIKAMTVDGPFDRQRFLQEARHQAKVDHANVCRIYEVGEHEGRPFLSMQLIEGSTLQELSGELDTEQKVELIRQVAEGMHAAHATGLIHRDLKPANIMVASTETGLRAYVVDFGIARQEGGPSLTRTGMVVGTPWYMAPEQISGGDTPLDRRTDVYALGTVLYELFAGRPPFAEESSMVVLTRVLTEEAPRLRQSLSDVPRDLERIVEQCLRKNPSERYESARALAEDLARYLAGDPVQATDGGVLGRASRWVRTHRALAATSALALIATVALGAVALRSRIATQRAAQTAQTVGREIERLDWVLRASQQLPFHDIRERKNVLRRQLHEFGTSISELAGDDGARIGDYVAGRGALMLDDLDTARELLQRAWQGGYRDPEVAASLGWALGRLYDREVGMARSLASADERITRLAEIGRDLKQPALDYLGLAEEGGSATGLLAAASLAAYSEDFDEALEVVDQIEDEFPWLHEARRLRGVIWTRRAQQAVDVRDREAAEDLLNRARAAFLEAAEIGRSDPWIFIGLCGLEAERLFLNNENLPSARKIYEQALAPCAQAITIDSGNADSHLARVQLRLAYIEHLEQAGQETRDIRGLVEHDARAALALRPQLASAYNALGVVKIAEARELFFSGADPRPTADEAVALFEQTLELDPLRQGPHQRIVHALWLKGRYVGGAGRIALLRESRAVIERLLAIDGARSNNLGTAGNGALQLADALNTAGQNPTPHLDEALEFYREAIERDPDAGWVYSNLAIVHLIRSRYELRTGKNPGPTLQEARSAVSQALELRDQDPFAWFNHGESYRQEARWLALGGVPAGGEMERFWEVIEAGRGAYSRGLELAPRIGQAWVDRARFDVMAAEVLIDQGKLPEAELDAARRNLSRASEVDVRRASGPCEMALALVLEKEAELLGRSLRSPIEVSDLVAGLNQCLALGPLNADYLRAPLRAAWRAARIPNWSPEQRNMLVEAGSKVAQLAIELQPDFVEAKAYASAYQLLAAEAGERPSGELAELQNHVAAVPRLAGRFRELR